MSTLPISLFLFLLFLFPVVPLLHSTPLPPPARIRTGLNRVPRTHYFWSFFFSSSSLPFLASFLLASPSSFHVGGGKLVLQECVVGESLKGGGAGVGGPAPAIVTQLLNK